MSVLVGPGVQGFGETMNFIEGNGDVTYGGPDPL